MAKRKKKKRKKIQSSTNDTFIFTTIQTNYELVPQKWNNSIILIWCKKEFPRELGKSQNTSMPRFENNSKKKKSQQ